MKSCLKLHIQTQIKQYKSNAIQPDVSWNPFLPVIHSKVIYLWTFFLHSLEWLSKGQILSNESAGAWCLFAVVGHAAEGKCSLLVSREALGKQSGRWSQVFWAAAWYCQGRQLASILVCPALYNPQSLHLIRLHHTFFRKPFKLPPGFTPALSSLLSEKWLFIWE